MKQPSPHLLNPISLQTAAVGSPARPYWPLNGGGIPSILASSVLMQHVLLWVNSVLVFPLSRAEWRVIPVCAQTHRILFFTPANNACELLLLGLAM